jgi:ankyrin repeat protein
MKKLLVLSLLLISMTSQKIYASDSIYNIYIDQVQEGIKIKKDITGEFDLYIDKMENLQWQSDRKGHEYRGSLNLYDDIFRSNKGSKTLQKYALYKDKFIHKLATEYRIPKNKIHVSDIDPVLIYQAAISDNDYSKFDKNKFPTDLFGKADDLLIQILNLHMDPDIRIIRKVLDLKYPHKFSNSVSKTIIGQLIREPISNKVEILKLLLKYGIEIKEVPEGGAKMCYANDPESYEMTRLLLSYGVDFNSIGYEGFNALSWAARNNNLKCLKLFVSYGVDLNPKYDIGGYEISGFTPLHFAVFCNNPEMVDFLLQNNADRKAIDHQWRSPKSLAQKMKLKEISELFKKKYDKPIQQVLDTALAEAVKNNDYGQVKALIKRGANVNGRAAPDKQYIIVSAAAMDKKILSLLLESGANISLTFNGLTALHSAVYREKKDNVELLLQAGANANLQDSLGTPLNHLGAIYHLEDEFIKEWRPKKKTVPEIYDNEIEIVKLLLKYQADINEQDKVGLYTPLHNAAFWGDYKLVKFLLDNGADKSIKDRFNKTPLGLAVEGKHSEAIELLK